MTGQSAGKSARIRQRTEDAAQPFRVAAMVFTGPWGMRIIVYLLALLVRAVYLLTIHTTPMVRFPVVDSEAYLAWAREIAAGEWIGTAPFYQSPLYSYFLAAVMMLVGDVPLLIRVVQIVIGAFSCAVLADAVYRSCSRSAGWIAGVMLALYPPSIFLCALIQKTVLDELGVVLMVWLILRFPPRYSPWICGGLGLALGALMQTRENAFVFIPVVLVWLVSAIPLPLASRLRRCAVFVVCASAMPSLVAWRNAAVCGEWLVTTYQGGTNFYIGNNPDANGSYVALSSGRGHTQYERIDAMRIAEAAAGRNLSPREISAFWYGRAYDFIRSQPLEWLRLLLLKSFYLVNRYEIPDSEDQWFYTDHSVVLAVLGPLWHLGLLVPLAAGGFVLLPRRSPEAWLIFFLALVFALSTIAFFILARYRYPLVPLLIPFAAEALARVFSRRTEDVQRRIGVAVAAACLVAVPANWATPFPVQAELATSYANAGIALVRAGETDAAERYLSKALELMPNNAAAHFGIGQVWLQRRKPAQAITALENALAERPGVPAYLTALGTARILSGEVDAAIACLRRSVQDDPYDPAAWSNLSEAYKRKRDWQAATDALRRGCEAVPGDADLRLRLAWLLSAAPVAEIRDGEAAMRLVNSVLAAAPNPSAAVLDALAAAYAESGRFGDAVRTAEQALWQCDAGSRQAERIRARLDLYRAGAAYRLE